MKTLITRVGTELIRRRHQSISELISGVYAALVHDLEERKLIRNSPFGAATCRGATLLDLDEEVYVEQNVDVGFPCLSMQALLNYCPI